MIANYGKVPRQQIADHLDTTVPAISMQAGKLGLRGKRALAWTEDELLFLEECYGQYKLSSIAKKLSRSEYAVELKAKRNGLGPSKTAQGFLTARDLARALGVDIHVVTNTWISKYGLKAKKKITNRKARFYQIDIKAFWKWAEGNQHRFDSRKMEYLSLGDEPSWMVQKRKADQGLAPRRAQKWSPCEDALLRQMFTQTYSTNREIGTRLGRSPHAVANRLRRIEVWQDERKGNLGGESR